MIKEKCMVTIDKRELLSKLGELLEIEIQELQKYSTTLHCSEAKKGMEDDYNRCANKARLIADIKYKIYFGTFYMVKNNHKK